MDNTDNCGRTVIACIAVPQGALAPWFPVCGNIIQATGQAVISCCGIVLPPLEAEEEDAAHELQIELVKLYPEGNAEARFKRNLVKWIYAYCNKHGFFRVKVPK